MIQILLLSQAGERERISFGGGGGGGRPSASRLSTPVLSLPEFKVDGCGPPVGL